jgi:hypothetical protein
VVPTISQAAEAGHTVGMASRRDVAAGGEQRPAADCRRVETLSLAEVVLAIIRAQRNAPLATAAAIVRERNDEGFLVRMRLLEGTPPLAGDPGVNEAPGILIAAFAAVHLGQELLDAFGENDVIILK